MDSGDLHLFSVAFGTLATAERHVSLRGVTTCRVACELLLLT